MDKFSPNAIYGVLDDFYNKINKIQVLRRAAEETAPYS